MKYGREDMRSVVAGEVRAHLARRGISGNQAALRLGWTQPYMSRRLSGNVAFNVADLAAIARLLQVPVTRFFDSPDAGTEGEVMSSWISSPPRGLGAAA